MATKNQKNISNPIHDIVDESKIDPKHKNRLDKQNLALDIIETKINVLHESGQTINKKIRDTSEDLSFLDNDVDNNINQVNRTNIITKLLLEQKDCCCGMGFMPIIIVLTVSFLLGVFVLVIAIQNP